MAIKSIKHKGLKKLYENPNAKINPALINPKHLNRLEIILAISKLYEQRKRAERENAVGDSTFDETADFTPVNVNIREHAIA